MKRKLISMLLSLSIFSAAMTPGATAYAAEGAEDDSGGNSDMVISKTATANGDGTYTIRLEAYATGDKVITGGKELPADIILVLDQSGSMDDDMASYVFMEYEDWTNSNLYERRHNDGWNPNLYHRLEDGSYAEVSVAVEETPIYTQAPSDMNNSGYYENRNNLYAFVNDEYFEVNVEQKFDIFSWSFTYTYSLDGGTIEESTGRNTIPNFGVYAPLYILSADPARRTYTYSYTDADGKPQTIEASAGADTVPDSAFYYRTRNGSTSKLEALKTAVSSFIRSVEQKAAGADGEPGTADDIDHCVAIVGFASRSGYDNNTELLSIDGWNSGSGRDRVGVAYDDIQSHHWTEVLQKMNTENGRDMVQKAINALAANGATRADLGMDMASRILAANPVPEGEERTRVVILFTDGSPTSSNGFEESVANAAIEHAAKIKNDGATVYSIGIFNGADATANGISFANGSRRENQFMQDVSSNNGKPQTPSYYLSASDSASLDNIFSQISDNIETGGANVTLDDKTVIKDVIAPAFTLPEGADASAIMLETYSYVGENQWEKNDDLMGAVASVEGDQVAVTGFDFVENYVGTVTENGEVTYRGNKLVISFPVKPRDGFLGGNNVETNSMAGVYENGEAKEPVFTFERPQVNVPIKDVTVTAEEKSVYLLGGLTADELRGGAEASVGGVKLDLTKPDQNFGLKAWQTEYVDITASFLDADGKPAGDLTELRDDTTYTVEVTVAPKPLPDGEELSTEGKEAVERTDNDSARINVFKPELTYKDSEVYYGDNVPASFTGNLTATRWMHDGSEADPDIMGTAPDLTLTYTPDDTKISDSKINTKQDIDVNASVQIGDADVTNQTAFLHTKCGDDCSWSEPSSKGTPAFLFHVKTCSLTIVKQGGAEGEPYVFTVCKDGQPYSEITIVGNGRGAICELPVGTYTIQEDEGWSWRYNASDDGSASLTAQDPEGSITCINKKAELYWLNGFSEVVKNVVKK